ncbi:hypothetical protein [Paenibacillus sp. J22TS3]|uniref:hypothetical protein n=1 Tax=Paenibacillus sp. J22TS3 TaxID=2807192 RepID=UPI001B1BC460|nr:hypothetical protein [Paenibacillus sp. J22TS3]GIP20089.1 hypothetical protein J22TS3_03640 [Paenibacillus sp. J22TS3]
MNCQEAQEYMDIMWDMSEDDPRRKSLEWHVLGCDTCAAEYEVWTEARDIVHKMNIEVDHSVGERVNRNVMDRIYAESPWLAPSEPEARKASRILNRRFALWIAGFMAVFISSLIYFMMPGGPDINEAASHNSGLLPIAIAGTDTVVNADNSYNLPDVSRGIIDPLIVKMSPAYPEYWMLLSILGMGLALFSWRGLRRIRR